MHKGRREARAVARARLRDNKLRRGRSECEKKKTISRNRTLHYAAGSTSRHYFESLLCALRIYSGLGKFNFDKGRENNCVKPRAKEGSDNAKVQKALPEEPLSSILSWSLISSELKCALDVPRNLNHLFYFSIFLWGSVTLIIILYIICIVWNIALT